MKNTVSTILEQKAKGEKITMLTAYDFSTAVLEDEAGVNTILKVPKDGVITEILVANEEVVDYGKGLVRIK